MFGNYLSLILASEVLLLLSYLRLAAKVPSQWCAIFHVFTSHSTHCMLTTIAVCGTKVLLGYLVCSDAKSSNAVGYIRMLTSIRRELWKATLKIKFVIATFTITGNNVLQRKLWAFPTKLTYHQTQAEMRIYSCSCTAAKLQQTEDYILKTIYSKNQSVSYTVLSKGYMYKPQPL